MGLVLGRVISVNGREVKIDLGAGNIVTADHTDSVGTDCPPVVDDYAVLAPLPGAGSYAVVSYAVVTAEFLAAPGERRTYSRDTEGVIAAQTFLKQDGNVEITTGPNSFIMKKDGSVDITTENATVSIKPAGDVELSNDGGGSVKLLASGVINLNGVTIDTSGNLISPTKITSPIVIANTSLLAGTGPAIEMVTHIHTDSQAGPTTGPENV